MFRSRRIRHCTELSDDVTHRFVQGFVPSTVTVVADDGSRSAGWMENIAHRSVPLSAR